MNEKAHWKHNSEVLTSGALKNWCFWTVVLKKTLESPLDSKEIQPLYPKGDESWVLIGKTDAKGETPILWPPDANSWLIGKDPDAGELQSMELQRIRHDWVTELNWIELLIGLKFLTLMLPRTLLLVYFNVQHDFIFAYIYKFLTLPLFFGDDTF